MRIAWHEETTIYKNSTKVLEFEFLQTGGAAVQDLSGWCGWVTFWYPGLVPHVQRAAAIFTPTNGVLTYFPVGDEFSTVGNILFQAEVMLVDHTDGTDRAYFTVCHQVVRARVVEKPQ